MTPRINAMILIYPPVFDIMHGPGRRLIDRDRSNTTYQAIPEATLIDSARQVSTTGKHLCTNCRQALNVASTCFEDSVFPQSPHNSRNSSSVRRIAVGNPIKGEEVELPAFCARYNVSSATEEISAWLMHSILCRVTPANHDRAPLPPYSRNAGAVSGLQ